MRPIVVFFAGSLLSIACTSEGETNGETDTDLGTGGSSTSSTGDPTTTASSNTVDGSESTSGTPSDTTSADDTSTDDTSGSGESTGPTCEFGVEGDGDFVIGPDYMNSPEIDPGPKVPRGDVHHFTMDSADSLIFPGVTGPYTRDVWVYVPQQYVDGSPAPFMVVQDGGGYRDLMSATLDTLIDAGEVPAMIGIFINPGPGDGMGSERGLEYDRVSEDYTNFIETEVLPIIPAVPEIAESYPNLQFTDDPWGRGSMGGSSGGAAAFTMGWLRPDLYRRILTYSGTFVRQHSTDEYPHGAWEYHEHLIAEAETKPLRIYIEVGDNDLNLDPNYNDGMHDWVEANNAMASALAEKGYHYRYDFAQNAGHVDGNVLRQTLPDVLRWMWSEYPCE